MLGQLVENGEVNKHTIIINFNHASQNQESSFKYWPNKGSDMELRNFVIETTSEEQIDNNVIKRVMKITHKHTVCYMMNSHNFIILANLLSEY